MRRHPYLIFIVATPVFAVFIMYSYDNLRDIMVSSPPDTTQMSFKDNIVTIPENNCRECHSNANTPVISGIFPEDYPDVKAQAVSGKL